MPLPDCANRHLVRAVVAVLVLSGLATPPHAARGQQEPAAGPPETGASEEPQSEADIEPPTVPEAPAKVEIEPVAEDQDIGERLRRILEATEWFQDVRVEVDEGVVFLYGTTREEDYKNWANELARNTEAVVAVVNRIRVLDRPLWDLSPAATELRSLAAGTVRWLPMIAVGSVLLAASWFAARLASHLARRFFERRLQNDILRQVASSLVAVPVFLLGLYLVLRILTLTRLAVTVLGGTGIAGLIIGIAFRDIAENYLASILLSTQSPFRAGDLIRVAGHTGFVQRVTTRGTLLMTLEGFYVQIPNATIYKETLVNLTSNPKMRQDFTVGIGYDTPISRAQEIAMRVLAEHPAVLSDPEPLVLVEQLGAATVNLHIYFWMDGHQHSTLRVKSSVIRLTKRAFEEAHISMPDEAREVVFTRPLDIRVLRDIAADRQSQRPPGAHSAPPAEPASSPQEPVASDAEGGLDTERQSIQDLAENAPPPDAGADLLKDHREKS